MMRKKHARNILQWILVFLCVLLNFFGTISRICFAQMDSENIPGYISKPGPGGVIFRCNFEQALDANMDAWPDGWTRYKSIGFPEYLEMEILAVPNPLSPNLFRFNMDGGNATVYSPMIPANFGMSYTASAYATTQNVERNDVYISLSFFDEDEKQVREQKTVISRKIRKADNWVELKVKSVSITDPKVKFVRIGLHVVGPVRQDTNGKVDFTAIELRQSPTVRLKTSNRNNIFYDPSLIQVTCEASGLPIEFGRMNFHLESPLGESLAEPYSVNLFDDDPARSSFIVPGKDGGGVIRGRANWRPPIIRPGFYRVRVEFERDEERSNSQSINIALLEPISVVPNGEFGWTFPNHLSPKEITEYRHLISQAGISMIKIPVWFGSDVSQENIDELANVCEWLADRQIKTTGLLVNPPEEVRNKIRGGEASTAKILSLEIDDWYPSLEPSLLRLAMLVRNWQFGADEDRSAMEIMPIQEKMTEIRDRLNKVGFDVSIGLGWDWVEPLPKSFLNKDMQPNPIRQVAFNPGSPEIPPTPKLRDDIKEFINLSNDVPLTHQELPHYLGSIRDAEQLRWYILRPISAQDYPMDERIMDLFHRMINAKIYGADAIFVPEPFNSDTGLMNIDEQGNATPDDLFLPWRTIASQIAGKRYAGSIRLPKKSNNLIFEGNNDTVMIVWNEDVEDGQTIGESIYLGVNVQITDLWGRRSQPHRDGFRQVFSSGKYPIIISGIDMKLIRWRQGFTAQNLNISSVIGQRQPNGFKFVNNSPDGIAGSIDIVPPNDWEITPKQHSFAIKAGESTNKTFNIMLSRKAVTEPQMLRFDVRTEGNDQYLFDIYEEIDVGGGDIKMQFVTRLNVRTGEMEVHQALINDGETIVNYECTLYVPGRESMNRVETNLGFGRRDYVYRIKDGASLIGKKFTIIARGLNAGSQPLRFEIQANR